MTIGTNPTAAVVRTEARLFTREPGALFWILVFPVVLLTILGLIPAFREADPGLGGRRVIDLYVPIAVLLSMIVAGIQTMPAVLSTYRERGILRRLSVTPARPQALLLAQILIHAVAVAASIVLALLVGRAVFGVAFPEQPWGYALAVLLTLAAALSIGAAIAAVSASARIAQTVGTIVFFPMMFCAGVWLPVQTMPDLLQRVVGVTPFGAASEILDQAARGEWPSAGGMAVVALWAVALTVVAVRWFRWE
ncbi:ABC transporter permease [Rhodococcus coprophilus]|uniref:ABC transporter permease n=1 Tax=Rhodococcus coprophilus TaxID=38310 RepID=UPI00343F79D3